MLVNKNCLNCNKEFQVLRYRAKIAKYCSALCNINLINLRHPKSGVYVKCGECENQVYQTPKKMRQFCSQKCLGIRFSVARKGKPFTGKTTFTKGFKPWNTGLKGFLSGKNHYNWKGGITDLNIKIRSSIEYEEWRKAVFERDNYTCQICQEVGGRLHADHIKPFALFPELRLELTNGRTLCESCHNKFGAKVNQYSTREQFEGRIAA